MKNFPRILWAALLLLVSACSLPVDGLSPAEKESGSVYTEPPQNYYRGARVGIAPFDSPPYAEAAGKAAADALYRELLKRDFFRELVFYENAGPPMRPARLKSFIRSRGLDLFITGRVRYYLEGGNFQASRVCEEVQALAVKQGEIAPVWQADACEQGDYRRARDYVLFSTKGRPAPSCRQLMCRLAGRFTAMFADSAGF
jgi:hypothetical protein